MLIFLLSGYAFFFFFNDTATTEIYTLSLHDALPICNLHERSVSAQQATPAGTAPHSRPQGRLDWRQCDHSPGRSEEHTSELQSHLNIVCRLLLEKKKTKPPTPTSEHGSQHLQLTNLI